MDRYTKITLGVIAVSLIGINLQMFGGSLISPAYAELSFQDFRMINDGINKIVAAIYSCNL